MENKLKIEIECLECGKVMKEVDREMNYDSGDVYIVVLECCGKKMLSENRF